MTIPESNSDLPPGAEAGSPFLSRSEGATELYLIRHADAVPSLEEVLAADADKSYDDQPLSQKGQRQAQALSNRLKSISFGALYASPLRRTQETAAPLAAFLSLPVTIEPDLREVEFQRPVDLVRAGGDRLAQLKALRAYLDFIVRTAATTGKWSGVPGAEPSASFRHRVVTVIDSIARRHPGERIAIFAHGGVINVYIAALLGLERDYFYPIYNAGINIARVQPKGEIISRLLVTLNDAAHLQAEPGLLTER